MLEERRPQLVTSKLAIVEVTRAGRVAGASAARDRLVEGLLDSCLLVDVSEEILERAATLVTSRLRSMDAIHLATAVYLSVEEMLVYDHRLADAARGMGITVFSPGA